MPATADRCLLTSDEARRGAEPLAQLAAHTLAVVLAVVPAVCAVFVRFTRRLDVAGAVVTDPDLAPPDLWDGDLAPRRAVAAGATVLTAAEPAAAAVYLRASGAVSAAIALLRQGDGFDDHEIGQLRRLQPLLEQAYAQAIEPSASAMRPDRLPLGRLTPREHQIAELVGTGSSNAQIAAALDLSPGTVKTHLTQIYIKLRLRSRTQLAMVFGPRG